MLDLRYQPTPSSPTGNYHHGRHQPQSSTTVTLALLLLLLLLKRPTRRPLEFPRILPRHARFVASAFAAFPEAVAFLADEPGVAEAAVFGAVVLLAGACEVGIFVSCLVFFGVYSRGHGSFGCALSYCLGWGWVWNGAYRSRCERKLALNATEDYV